MCHRQGLDNNAQNQFNLRALAPYLKGMNEIDHQIMAIFWNRSIKGPPLGITLS